MIRSAIFPKTKQDARGPFQSKSGEKVSYADLVKRFNWTKVDFMVECMEDVEKTLAESRELKGRLVPPNQTVTIVVFCWVCMILGVRVNFANCSHNVKTRYS